MNGTNKPKVCSEPNCLTEFYYLRNEKTGKYIPVDLSSINDKELLTLQNFGTVLYDSTRHISHFKTCKNPNKFSKTKK